MSSYCFICKHTKAEDSIEVECGNNAENSVTLPLCEAHLQEAEDTGYDFQCKYAEKIEEEWLENQLGHADMLRKAAKENPDLSDVG
jgi:hypothetical protein